MAGKKKESGGPSRTMRSDPPASLTEALRTVPKGCTESIRKRTGVNDEIRLELPDPDELKPSTESALEFAPEIMGNPTFKSATVSALISIDEAEGPALLSMSLVGEGPDPMPGLQAEGGELQAFSGEAAENLGEAIRERRSAAPARQRIERKELMEVFEGIQEMIEIAPLDTRKKYVEELFLVKKDPLKRAPDERFGANPSKADILRAIMARLKRFQGARISPLTKESVRGEIRQMEAELEELGVIERII